MLLKEKKISSFICINRRKNDYNNNDKNLFSNINHFSILEDLKKSENEKTFDFYKSKREILNNLNNYAKI